MYRINKIVYLFFLTSILCFSCKKQEDELMLEIHKKNVSEHCIFNTYFNGDSIGFCCSGTKNKIGQIWQTLNGGEVWFKIFEIRDTCIYALNIINDSTLFVCGDHLFVFNFNLKTKQCNRFVFPFSLEPAYDISLHDIQKNNKGELFICGGESYDRGATIKFLNPKTYWALYSYTNEMRKIALFENGNSIVAGYGIMMQANDSHQTEKTIDIKNDFFVDLSFPSSSIGFAAGYEGNLYKTNNAGSDWLKTADFSGVFKNKTHFHSVYFINESIGFACGNNGLLLRSNDGGNSWKKFVPATASNLINIAKGPSKSISISDDKGNMYTFKY